MSNDPFFKLIRYVFGKSNIIGYRIFCTILAIYTMYFHWGERADFKSDVIYIIILSGMYIWMLCFPRIMELLINEIEKLENQLED